MSIWPADRLPIVVPPIPGEGLDSWIEAYARRLHTCSRGLLNHLGLTQSQPRRMVTIMTGQERQILSTATGVAPALLSAMTLQRFDGIAVTINHARRVLEHPPAWRRHTGSRYCPTCLQDDGGRWQLAWRLPWAAICPRHHRLLADTCPACGRRPHPDRPGDRGQPTPPGACTTPVSTRSNGGGYTPACAHPLTEVNTTAIPTGGTSIHAAEHIHHLIDAAVAGDTDAPQLLGDLFILAHKALAAVHTGAGQAPPTVRQVIAECGDILPPPFAVLGPIQAHTIAAAGALAVAAATDNPTGASVLAWLVRHDRRLAKPEPHILLGGWQQCTPQLTSRVLALFDDQLRVHHRLAYRTPTPRPTLPRSGDTEIRRRAAALPALLWPSWSMRLIPTTTAAYHRLDAARSALAVMTLIPGSRLTHQQAVDLLGRYTTTGSAKTILTRLPADQCTATIRLLTQLADALDTTGAPIDYTRRRTLFNTDTTTIDPTAYAALAADHGWRPPSTLQLRILDRHLVTTLTGTAGHTRIGPTRHGTGNAFNPLLAALPPPARQFVRDQAQQLLDAHGITEPLTWQPPAPANPDAPWPGIDPNSIDHDQFTDAFTRHATAPRPLARLGDATGLNPTHIRLYTELIDLNTPEHQWDALAADTSGAILSPDRLRHLYHHQQSTLSDIARRSLTTERVIRRTLTNSGTRLLSRRPRSTPIPLEWFQQNYINTGKTIRQAAAEAGVSRNTFSKYARLHNIPPARRRREAIESLPPKGSRAQRHVRTEDPQADGSTSNISKRHDRGTRALVR